MHYSLISLTGTTEKSSGNSQQNTGQILGKLILITAGIKVGNKIDAKTYKRKYRNKYISYEDFLVKNNADDVVQMLLNWKDNGTPVSDEITEKDRKNIESYFDGADDF